MRTVIFGMPDLVPHFFDKRFRVPGQAGPMFSSNIPDHEFWTADLIIHRKRVKAAIAEVIRKYRPQVVGLSAMSFQYYSACRTAEVVRSIDPSIRIGLGGYHATVNFDRVAESPEGKLFDFIVRGEGETTMGSYLDRLENQRDLDDVPGLSFRRGDDWINNPPSINQDLSTFRPPRRANRIWNDFGYYGMQLDVFETSRGCTLPCNFCSITQMYGRTFREFEIDFIRSGRVEVGSIVVPAAFWSVPLRGDVLVLGVSNQLGAGRHGRWSNVFEKPIGAGAPRLDFRAGGRAQVMLIARPMPGAETSAVAGHRPLEGQGSRVTNLAQEPQHIGPQRTCWWWISGELC